MDRRHNDIAAMSSVDDGRDLSKSSENSSGVSLHPKSEEASTTLSESPDFPNGGLKAWCTVAGAAIVQFSTFGVVNAFGVFQDFYVRDYLKTSTASDIGWIGGVQIGLTLGMGIFTGKLFDRGYFYWLNAISLVLYAVSIFMLSLSHRNQYYQVFLSQGLAFGLSSGLSYIPCYSIPGHYFTTKRPLALGIISAGSAIGAIVQPIMLNRLFAGPLGFHNGVRVNGALNVFLMLLANCMMRTRLPGHSSGPLLPSKKLMTDVPYIILLMSSMFAFLGLFFPIIYLQLYATQHDDDLNFAFYSLSILNAASFFGRLLSGALAPIFGAFNLTVFFVLATGGVGMCMAAVHNRSGIIAFAVFYGLTSGACMTIVPAMLAGLIDDQKEYGVRLGIFFFFGGVFALVSIPIAGALLTEHKYWIRAIMFAGACMVFAGLLELVARGIVAKKKGKQKF